MKRIISTILRNGFTKSKKDLKVFVNYLYPLQYILKKNDLGWVICNDNPFWRAENNKNRTELYHDVYAIQRAKITDASYFHIINRFENGDRYGIEV